MPFVANTPESKLGRTDSLSPESTCVGLTSSGRLCRRSVPSTGKKGPLDRTKEASYCSQHRNQAKGASNTTARPPRPAGGVRDSIDTLAERMGLASIDGRPSSYHGGGGGGGGGSGRGLLMTLLCCLCSPFDLDDGTQRPPSPRPGPRPVQHHRPASPISPQDVPAGIDKAAAAKHLPFILSSTDAATTAALLKELTRPFVNSEEPGFIYMFWMTPDSKSNPPVEAARSLLSPPSSSARDRSRSRDRSPSDIVSSYADRSTSRKSNTMLLKIGRAANVQRRMNQWQRQCGYDIEVLRFYPWVSSSSDDASGEPCMTPHVHRVERLIHLELAGLGLKLEAAECSACGKEHREWFETEASRDGVRIVDEVIRRWIRWDETLSSKGRKRRN